LRVNLGIYQKEVNVLWDLAPHDVSILLTILKRSPTHISAVGNAHVTAGIEDVVVLTLHFEGGPMAKPNRLLARSCKVREVTVVGRKKNARL